MCGAATARRARGRRSTSTRSPATGRSRQLASVIDRTMPEDDPDKLDAAGSKRVAEYIYERSIRPSRRPNRSRRASNCRGSPSSNTATPSPILIGSFRRRRRSTTGAACAASISTRATSRAAPAHRPHRCRGEVRLRQVGAGTRRARGRQDEVRPHQFCIRWEGSVLAPETGMYEFVVRTDHATRLWVNDARKPLIDKWVKSGSDTEYRESIFLLAGGPTRSAGVLEGQAGRGRLQEEGRSPRRSRRRSHSVEAAEPR